MKKILTVTVLIFTAIGCDNSYTPPSVDVESDSLRAVIDSVRIANSKNRNIGKHTHANLAAQAHQNPVKKTRMLENRNKIRPRRERKMDDNNLARKQKMIDLGLMTAEEANIEVK